MVLSYISLSAICFVSGVYIADFFFAGHLTDIIALLILLCSLLSLFVKIYRSYIIISALFLFLGICGYAINQSTFHNTFKDITGKYVTMEGYIADLPEENNGIYSYKLKTTKAEYLNVDYKTGQVIRLTSKIPLKYGDFYYVII